LAHSLFEPTPVPVVEKLWNRVRTLDIALQARATQTPCHDNDADQAMKCEVKLLDARGRQHLLREILTNMPIK
jgi:hypothetical protein